MKETGYKKANYKIPEKEFPYTKGLPNVKLIGTGGTIASRLDYRTGAVIPAFTPGELYGAVPELADICNLTTEKVFAVFSENMGPEQYKKLAIAIGKEIENGIDGIIIGHGTDTLHHTAAAFTFMVQNPYSYCTRGLSAFFRPSKFRCCIKPYACSILQQVMAILPK